MQYHRWSYHRISPFSPGHLKEAMISLSLTMHRFEIDRGFLVGLNKNGSAGPRIVLHFDRTYPISRKSRVRQRVSSQTRRTIRLQSQPDISIKLALIPAFDDRELERPS